MSPEHLKVYLCGSRSFGAAALEMILRRGHEVAGVSGPEAEGERPDRLHQLAREHGLHERFTPVARFGPESVPAGTDLIVAAHSHAYFGAEARARARLGCLGYHPSLLPLHRGRDAVRWTVHMRDRVTGGTAYWYTDQVDAGPVAAQDWCFVRPEWTPSDLWAKELFPMGIRLLDQVFGDVEAGRVIRRPQDEALASWEPSWERPPMSPRTS